MKNKSIVQLSKGPDYWVIATMVVLLIIGSIMIYTTTLGWNPNASPMYFFWQHIEKVAIGAACMYVASRIDYHTWGRWPWPLLIAGGTALLLVALWIMSASGLAGDNAGRWLAKAADGGKSLQPSELAKPAMIVYMAAWLSAKGNRIKNLTTGFVPFALLLGLMVGLVVIQPDLSTGAVIALTCLSMFYVAGADAKQFAALLGLSVPAGVAAIALWGYRSQRISSWLSSLLNPTDTAIHLGEQAWECTTALSSGGIFGVGLGGSQHKTAFGNMVHTDLIMAVIGEELGIVGSFLILSLVLLLAYRGIKISREAPDQFGCLLATGVTAWLTIQAMVHIGVIAEAIPVTGMPLPFVSYGGSALVVEMASIGVLLNISKQRIREGSIRGALFASGGRNRRPRLSVAHRD